MNGTDEQEYLDFATARAGALYRTACLLTAGDRHLAEDLVQETLGRMYAQWRRVASADNPAAYAHTVLVRAFLSHRRRRSAGEQPTGQLPENVAAEGDATLRLTLLDALSRLHPRDRTVLVLRYWEDRSVEESARVLRISAGAVRTQSSRALVRLRAVLGDSLTDLSTA
ncbi:SigE family RNA polymerase sigma factor [Streptacidiphilus fuscans]|uniref:SigE family RNA polymerase sigma factor n=1 Tax=Streptacidiphilus fuscans TaxID=2789292 RepID=A0A931B9I5_9ACTN|nr:SigE family RNA polymerase sigma factor [Streptacidiphilus fuscans]MBF9072218.1 SigE family RNA polymerase sigma factor [Streptacidiphilus fuscans]MBF9073029.1 SigE family RNA polymerase sigma factor [Streptacidiphilus fuscans]